jgi:succinate dehydrogenase / fumarate reductase cytochrome b subunit
VYHGLWSSTQTLAVRNPTVLRARRAAAAVVAGAIVVGNVSIPVAVLAGLVR